MTDLAHLDRIKARFFRGQEVPVDLNEVSDICIVPSSPALKAPAEEDFVGAVAPGLAAAQDIQIYIHFPFCRYQCSFCFVQPYQENAALEEKYVRALLKEIDLVAQAGYLERCRIKGIYFGGGTPADMALTDFAALLDAIRSRFVVTENADITCEAHPESLAGERGRELLAALRDQQVNRVSIGSQSLDARVLALCTRRHAADATARALDLLGESDIWANLDMMFGLPGQTLASVEHDLTELERLRPAEINYQRHAFVNPRAHRLYRDHPEYLVDREEYFAMVLAIRAWLWEHGYEQDGSFTRASGVNPYRNQWLRGRPYWAFGNRAHGHLGSAWFMNHSVLGDYFRDLAQGRLPRTYCQVPTERELMFRRLHFALQTREGMDEAAFATRFGLTAEEAFPRLLARLRDFGMIERAEGALRPTALGVWFYDDVICEVVDAAVAECRPLRDLENAAPLGAGALGVW